MSTHVTSCAVCAGPCYCSSITHALGCGDGGCFDDKPKINFCSEKCFHDLEERMKERWRIYLDIRDNGED